MSQQKPLVVAVAGNPNAGKSTLINAIAGSRLQVGNWPGVTVEKKETQFEVEGRNIRLVDLPGCYSLSPYSQEEIITRDYLVSEKPDLIINVVDATNLERNLYLTMQLLELGISMIMALNIFDEAEAKGYKINTRQMEETLGIRVIPTSAVKKTGLEQLLKAVVSDSLSSPRNLNYGEDIETALSGLRDHIQRSHANLLEQYPQRWLLLKLLEGDNLVFKTANIPAGSLPPHLFEHLLRAHGDDLEGLLADTRYALSAGLCREVLSKPEKRNIELTEKIDRIVQIGRAHV
nr:ferrous iron transporter B [Trichlorobacter lovleyi]